MRSTRNADLFGRRGRQAAKPETHQIKVAGILVLLGRSVARNMSDEPQIDVAMGALPYIDTAYADPSTKQRVQSLIDEEMKSYPYDPARYESRLGPAPRLSFEVRLFHCVHRLF